MRCFAIDEYGQFIMPDGLFMTNEEADSLIKQLEHYKTILGKEEANAEILKEREHEKHLLREQYKNTPSIKKVSNDREIGYVYFIESEKGGIKIGKTSNIKSRMKALQNASPYKLNLLYSVKVENYGEYEIYLHYHFREKRLEGEWFDITHEEVRNFLKKEGFDVGTRAKL